MLDIIRRWRLKRKRKNREDQRLRKMARRDLKIDHYLNEIRFRTEYEKRLGYEQLRNRDPSKDYIR